VSRPLWLAALAAAAALTLPAAAGATQGDLFGASIRSVGLAGGGTAMEDGAAALVTSPAALGLLRKDRFTLDWLGGHVALDEVEGVRRLDGSPDVMPKVTVQPQVLSVGLGKTIGPWVTAGVHVQLPLPWIYFHETKDPWVPYSMRWQNRVSRGMGTAGLSVRVPVRGAPRVGGVLLDDALQGGLWLGFAVSLRPQGVINVDLDIVGLEPENEDDPPQVVATLRDVDLAAKYVLRPQASILFDLGTFAKSLEGIRVGASWAAGSTTDIAPIRLDVEVIDLENVNQLFSVVDLIRAEVYLALTDMYDPHQVRWSLAVDRPRFAITVDVQVDAWAQLVASYGRVGGSPDDDGGSLTIEFSDALGGPQEYDAIGGRDVDPTAFRDTLTLILGGELRPAGLTLPKHQDPLEFMVRAGVRYQQGAVRPSDGPSGILDGDVLTGAAGLRVAVPVHGGAILDGPLILDGAVQVQRLFGVDLPKTEAGLEGIDVPVRYDEDARWPGGWVVAGGLSAGVQF